MFLFDSKDEVLAKEKYLLSEDGRELLIKGSVDQVVKLKIVDNSKIILEDNNCIIILQRK